MSRRKKSNSSGRQWCRRGKRLVRLGANEAENEPFRKICKTTSVQKSTQKQANIRTLSILDLPDECIGLILEKLNLKAYELCEITKVCKKFYDVSLNPRLWRIADFRFDTYLFARGFHVLDITQDISQYLSDVERREMFANFLIKRKALLSQLRITFDIDKEMEIFCNLLDNCSLRNLKNVDIRWTIYWQNLSPAQRELQSECFKKVLEKLSTISPDISFLKCQLLGSIDMAEVVGKLKNIQSLNLVFIGFNEIIKRGVLDLILSSLPKLKELKIKVRQMLNESLKGYSLKSDSLEHLDFSWSKGLRIRELNLPHLHTFMAVNVFEFFQGRSCPCLFELISNGCPELTRINFKRSKVAGLDNFGLDEDDKREMHICQCDIHAPWRIQE